MQTDTWPGAVMVRRDPNALMESAAEVFAKCANASIAARGRVAIALSGGSTPRALYELLATRSWRDRIDWRNLHLFWSDERYVPPSDETSNYRMTSEALLSHVPIPPENVHRYMTEEGSAPEVAERYEHEIRGFFGDQPASYDLILLGLGTNAHTASLFPGAAALKERSRLVVADHIVELRAERLTFTAGLINSARAVCFLVCGREKAEVTRDVLTAPYDPERMPAQLVRPTDGELIWLLDSEAARLLPASLRR